MVTPTDQLRDAAHKPDWARFTRLAGDHAAILFEDLRRRVSRIDGLREELFYHAPEGERTDPTVELIGGGRPATASAKQRYSVYSFVRARLKA